MKNILSVFLLYCLGLSYTLLSQPQHADVFKYINLDYPGLEKVKSAFDNGEIAKAEMELLNYYRSRTNIKNNFSEKRLPADVNEANDNIKNIFDIKTIRKDFKNEIKWKEVQIDREWQFSLGRMNWFLNYVGVYKKSNDEKYVTTWMNQIISWISLGDPGYPRTIDTGRRMENWIYSYLMFVEQLKSKVVTPGFNSLFLASLFEQAEFIYNPQNWRRYSNWGTFENAGLSKLVILFPEFKNTQKWLSEIFFRMRVQLENSFHDDGMHIEVSPSYHSHELEVWLDFLELTKINNVDNPWRPQMPFVPIDQLIQKCATALMHIYKPTGVFPMLGDTDEKDERILLGRLSKYLNNPSLLYVASGGKEGTIPQKKSSAFPEGGYYIMRSGWGGEKLSFKDEYQLIFDCGTNQPWHAHFDVLNVVASAYGNDLLTDAGRYTYNDGIEREQFKGTAYHNTVVVDSKSQQQNYTPQPAKWNFMNEYDYIIGESDAYPDVKHIRSIFFVKGEYWLVIDRLMSESNHNYDQYWNLSDKSLGKIEVDVKTNQVLTPYLMMFSPSDANVKLETEYISYDYLVKKEKPVIRINYTDKKNIVIPQLIYPYNNQRPEVKVEFAKLNNQEHDKETETPAMIVTLQGENYFDIIIEKQSAGKLISYNGIETDAKFVFIRKENNLITKIVMIDGSLLKDNKTELIDFYSKYCNAEINNDSINLSGNNICSYSVFSYKPKNIFINNEKQELSKLIDNYYKQN